MTIGLHGPDYIVWRMRLSSAPPFHEEILASRRSSTAPSGAPIASRNKALGNLSPKSSSVTSAGAVGGLRRRQRQASADHSWYPIESANVTASVAFSMWCGFLRRSS